MEQKGYPFNNLIMACGACKRSFFCARLKIITPMKKHLTIEMLIQTHTINLPNI